MLLRWQKKGPCELSEKIRSSLISQFRMEPFQTPKLSYMEKRGTYAGRRVRYVRVFDPSLIPGQGSKTLKTYDNLSAHRQAVLFEGHIEKDGMVHLVDHRPRQRPETSAPPRT